MTHLSQLSGQLMLALGWEGQVDGERKPTAFTSLIFTLTEKNFSQKENVSLLFVPAKNLIDTLQDLTNFNCLPATSH